MKQILLIGAGRSSSSLIQYLVANAESYNWFITIADMTLDTARKLTAGSERVYLCQFDVKNENQRQSEIQKSDIVISMLPAFMHMDVARDCVTYKKNMVTASYVSEEMKKLDVEAKKLGIILMNEVGVDPGIDHMSAMKVIDHLKKNNAKIIRFESFTGGLLAPESDNNPWNYKFTWNPRNVVLAGQGSIIKFIQEGQYKYIPYQKMFRRTEFIDIEGYGRFEGYANRDSLKYVDVYNLHGIPTIYRGTLRRPGFCRAWDVFVQLGATDDSYIMEGSETMTNRQFINSFLKFNPHDSVELKLMHYLHLDQDSDIIEKLNWLGIFDNTPIGLKQATPAQILQHILEQKWKLDPHDKDMIVMWHKFEYIVNDVKKGCESSMVCIGDDQLHTAMAKTVGLTVAICSKLILDGTIRTSGVIIPVTNEIYDPVLKELESFNIVFNEKEVEPEY